MQSENDSTTNQRDRAKLFAKHLGEDLTLYEDIESGSRSDRTNWTRLKKDIEGGKVTIVWANENDRLGRNIREAATFWDLCSLHQVRLFVGDKEIDYESDSDFLEYGFASLISESDRRKIRKKTKETKAIVINDGRNTFRQLYGYDFDIVGAYRNRPLRKWFSVKEEVSVIKDVYKWYLLELVPVNRICLRLNEMGKRTKNGRYFSFLTIYHMLHQLEYTSYTLDKSRNRIKSKIYTEEIVTLEDFDEVQRKYPTQSTQKSFVIGRPASHIASGLLKCKHCNSGYFFHANKPPNGHAYYHNNSLKCKDQINKTLSYQVINWFFDDVYLSAMSENPKEIYNKMITTFMEDKRDVESEVEEIKKRCDDVNKKIKRLIDAIENDDDDSLIFRLKERKIERKQLEETLIRLRTGIEKEEMKISKIVANFSYENIQRYFDAKEKDRMIMVREVVELATVGDGCLYVRLIDGREIEDDYAELKKEFRADKKLDKKKDAMKKNGEFDKKLMLILADVVDNLNKAEIEATMEGINIGDTDSWFELLGRKLDGETLNNEEELLIKDLIQKFGKTE